MIEDSHNLSELPNHITFSLRKKTHPQVREILEKARNIEESNGVKFVLSNFLRKCILYYGEQIWGIKSK